MHAVGGYCERVGEGSNWFVSLFFFFFTRFRKLTFPFRSSSSRSDRRRLRRRRHCCFLPRRKRCRTRQPLLRLDASRSSFVRFFCLPSFPSSSVLSIASFDTLLPSCRLFAIRRFSPSFLSFPQRFDSPFPLTRRPTPSAPHPFTSYLLSHAPSTWERYVNHPFPNQLAQGTVKKEAFLHFIVQD